MQIKSFKDLVRLAPQDLKTVFFQQWQAPQNPQYHPEGNTLKHIAIVVNRALAKYPNNINIVLSAFFHDLGKFDALAFNVQGQPTAHGHEDLSVKLVDKYEDWIKQMGGDINIIRYIVSNHMKMKPQVWDVMRSGKKEKINTDPNFKDLESFATIDRGGNAIPEQEMESIVAEDYPTSFDHNVFKTLNSFAKRKEYCDQHLQKIAQGSGRIVYAVDNKMVLKLAKNARGIAQNNVESSLGNDSYIEDICATVYDSHPDDHWLEMERAKKLTPQRFKQLLGFDVQQLGNYLYNYDQENNSGRYRRSVDPNQVELIRNHDITRSLIELITNFNLMPDDLGAITSYGEVMREGKPDVILVDFGYNDEVYMDYYAKPGATRFSRYR
jgi:hypothetical protein